MKPLSYEKKITSSDELKKGPTTPSIKITQVNALATLNYVEPLETCFI